MMIVPRLAKTNEESSGLNKYQDNLRPALLASLGKPHLTGIAIVWIASTKTPIMRAHVIRSSLNKSVKRGSMFNSVKMDHHVIGQKILDPFFTRLVLRLLSWNNWSQVRDSIQ
ncbi:MAG: hypothetical protein F4W92_03655 [Gammaproteobacteria bacterium]|nr:hypothetical protein [Gammaproteobacteria bacterium]